jgi:hypothetical protein
MKTSKATLLNMIANFKVHYQTAALIFINNLNYIISPVM